MNVLNDCLTNTQVKTRNDGQFSANFANENENQFAECGV